MVRIGDAGYGLLAAVSALAMATPLAAAPLDAASVKAFIAGLYPSAGYHQVFERSDVYVFRRA